MGFTRNRKRGQPGNPGQFAADVSGKTKYPTAAPGVGVVSHEEPASASVSAAYSRFVQEQEARDIALLQSGSLSGEEVENIYLATPSPYVRGLVAGHDAVSAAVRRDLAERFLDEPDVRLNLALNGRSEASVLADVVDRSWRCGDVSALRAAAGHLNVDGTSLVRLSGHPDRGVRARAVWNENFPAEGLVQRMRDPDPEVRLGVADSPNASEWMLVALRDPDRETDSWIRTAAAANLAALKSRRPVGTS